jgi:squalene-associated FAD-dependent desaturase
MAGCAKPRGGPRMKRIVVIGGGLAGIAAALDCAQGGTAVTLLESRGRLGGAAYSFTRDGILADNGQHVFLRCCTAYRDLLERIGATELAAIQPRLAIPVLGPGGATSWLRRTSLPAPLHLAGSLLRYRFLSPWQRLSVARAMQALRDVDPDDPAADARSFGEWLSEHGQSQQAVEAIWELIARPTLNLRVSDASLAQAAYVFQEGLLGDPAAGDVGYSHVPLGEIHDVRARRALARAGVEVRLRGSAAAIETDRAGFHVLISGAPTLRAEAVVLAVPPDRAGRLAPPGSGLDRARLRSLGTSPIVNLHVVYDRHVMELPFAAGVGTPVQWVFDRTAAAGLERGQYLAVSLSAADAELDMTADELRGRFLPALADLLPAARGARVETFFVTREHAATVRASPGARALRPGPQTGLGGLLLAGAWTDTGWPATMEGAVRSGRTAAQAALATLAERHETPAAVAV